MENCSHSNVPQIDPSDHGVPIELDQAQATSEERIFNFQKKIDLLTRVALREKTARLASEKILEAKSRNLYEANQKLENQFNELQETQLKLAQTEKMASIGHLAAGVAHEINNPIGYVNSNVQLLQEMVDPVNRAVNLTKELVAAVQSDDKTRLRKLVKDFETQKLAEEFDYVCQDFGEAVSESRDGLDRVAEIVRDLKGFTRLDGTNDFQPADLNECIETTIKFCPAEMLLRNVHHLDLHEDLPAIECNSRQINQVILNLLLNAFYAVDESGEIFVSTSIVGEKVHATFRDTGRGIAPDIISQIFDPFFTTKPVGSGTGLGLSVSYQIVKNHLGEIQVVSEVGKGTTFTLVLPIRQLNRE